MSCCKTARHHETPLLIQQQRSVISAPRRWRCPTDTITFLHDREYMAEITAKITLLSQGLAEAGIMCEAA